MTQRTMPFIVAGAVVLLAIITVTGFLGLPAWVGIVGGLLPVLLMVFLLKQKRDQAIAAPILKARVEIVLSRIGMADVPVTPVDGAGLPAVYQQEGDLCVSPRAGELLSDEELGAMAIQAFCRRPDVLRRETMRYYAPHAAVLLLAAAASLYTGFPWIGPVLFILLVWVQLDIRTRPLGQRAMDANVQAFLDRGGNASDLLSGLIKMQGALIRTGLGQGPTLLQCRGALEAVVRVGGIDRDEAERVMVRLQAPPELRPVDQAKARRQMWMILLVIVLVMAAALNPDRVINFITQW